MDSRAPPFTAVSCNIFSIRQKFTTTLWSFFTEPTNGFFSACCPSAGESGITGLACDWLTGNLFWVNQRTKSISMIAADGSDAVMVLGKNISPLEIVLLPVERWASSSVPQGFFFSFSEQFMPSHAPSFFLSASKLHVLVGWWTGGPLDTREVLDGRVGQRHPGHPHGSEGPQPYSWCSCPQALLDQWLQEGEFVRKMALWSMTTIGQVGALAAPSIFFSFFFSLCSLIKSNVVWLPQL